MRATIGIHYLALRVQEADVGDGNGYEIGHFVVAAHVLWASPTKLSGNESGASKARPTRKSICLLSRPISATDV